MAVDAYTVNLTTGAVTKNGTALTNVLDVQLFWHANFNPGPAQGPAPQFGFSLHVLIHDTAADARILAQGPAGLLGGNVAAFAGKPSVYRLHSKSGDTVALTNAPATIAAAGLEGQASDGFQP